MLSSKLIALLPLTILFSTPVQAQTSAGSLQAPASILCTQIENFGNITDRSINHAHEIMLNLVGQSDGQYTYSGYAKNHKDKGGGETMTVTYDATTGQLVNGTSGFMCPQLLTP